MTKAQQDIYIKLGGEVYTDLSPEAEYVRGIDLTQPIQPVTQGPTDKEILW